MSEIRDRYDALVIGGGIAGMQAALDLGDQGYEVLLVEKDPSIGGVMVGLNKVFPTLDCSSCICTPRMAETAHHPRIRVQTWTEVERIARNGTGFEARLRVKPRYVVEDQCLGCGDCEDACPVEVPHEFDFGLGARRAIYIPHANAIPQKAVLDVEHCIFCGKCASACPAQGGVDFLQEALQVETRVGTVVVATGGRTTPMGAKAEYGGDRFPNVLHPLALERLQSSSGPFGRVLRPSDGKIPESVAWVQCAGSRDHSIGIPYCSRVCCMYALKQALLLKHQIHDVEATLYYMDIRAFGKGFEQFYRRAEAEGVRLVKGKVARIREVEDANLLLRIELVDDDGSVAERRHDLVVLSQGLVPGWHPGAVLGIEEAADGFLAAPGRPLHPAATTLDGVFAGGVAMGPRDIPDSVVGAGAAAMAAARYLEQSGWQRGEPETPALAVPAPPAELVTA